MTECSIHKPIVVSSRRMQSHATHLLTANTVPHSSEGSHLQFLLHHEAISNHHRCPRRPDYPRMHIRRPRYRGYRTGDRTRSTTKAGKALDLITCRHILDPERRTSKTAMSLKTPRQKLMTSLSLPATSDGDTTPISKTVTLRKGPIKPA